MFLFVVFIFIILMAITQIITYWFTHQIFGEKKQGKIQRLIKSFNLSI